MRKNKLTIVIENTLEDVFNFTVNPKNTHLWISSIKKELSEKFPPEIGTIYKNCGNDLVWDFYKVTEYVPNRIFALSDLEGNYNVKYSYKKISKNKTELEYYEWMNKGELTNPFEQNFLNDLKITLEKI